MTAGSRTARQELWGTDDRFRAFIESVPDAVIVADSEGRIVLANEETTNLFGYPAEALLGQEVEFLLPERLHEGHRKHRKAFAGDPRRRPMGSNLELVARRQDGSEVPVEVSLSPVTAEEGTFVVAALRDATLRRKAEEALRKTLEKEQQAVEDLRSLDQAKNTFLSAVSHELRTPLTVILGLSQTLQRPELRTEPELQVKLLERLEAQAERLSRMLSDLLDLDRLMRGIVEPKRRPTNLRTLITSVLGDLEQSGHPISVDVPDLVAHVDPAQVERIVENLVRNAIKHTPPATPIWIGAVDQQTSILLTVEDAGPGVHPDMRKQLFHPFVQGTGPADGTGVGLALVSHFARLHGGRAWVVERSGGGASFRILLPCESGDEKTEGPTPSSCAKDIR